MNRVFLLPASNYQSKLYNFLKGKNCEIFTINPVENHISKDNEKNHFYCDIFNVNEIVDFLKDKNIDFGFSDQSDIAITPFTEICEKLNLKHNSKESVVKFSCNKKSMYDFACSLGINHFGSEIIESFDQIKTIPAVIKPSDSTNSRGVYLINTKEDFDNLFYESKSFSRSKKIICQKLAPKDSLQITVEGICLNNKHMNLTSSLKGSYWQIAITSCLKYPLSNYIDKDTLSKIYNLNNKFVEKTGLDYGLTHAEYILTKDCEIYLNEIACRGGGFKITSDIIPYVCGFDPYENIFNYLKTGLAKFPQFKKEKFALMKFYKKINLDNSVVNKISKMEFVLDFGYDFTKKEYFKNKTNPRHSYLLVGGLDEKEVVQNIEKVENIIYESPFCCNNKCK